MNLAPVILAALVPARWLASGLLLAVTASAGTPDPAVSPLAKIHAMDRREAALAKPVRVSGVVTFACGDGTGSFVIEDDQAGVFIDRSGKPQPRTKVALGALVEVTGITGAGGYSPMVSADQVEVVGNAPLPATKPVTVSQLLTGRFDCRRVEIPGVVQHADQRASGTSPGFAVELAGEFGRLSVFALDADRVEPADLIDAEVVVRGVCFPFFNERAQVVGVRIEMNSARNITVERQPRPDPFAAPILELDELLAFSPVPMDFHRQRVLGTVTMVAPGEFLYLQEGLHSVRVNLTGDVQVRAGDRIEAVGFPQVRRRFVELQRALVRKTGVAPVPAPITTTRAQVLRKLLPGFDRATGDFDGRLLTLHGKLEKIGTREGGQRQILFDSDGQVVTALLGNHHDTRSLDGLPTGTRIAVTGICVVDYEQDWPAFDHLVPVAMRLLLREPGDIRVIDQPPWWTARRLGTALGIILSVLVVSLAWGWLLRRQVVRRTEELATEIRARHDAEVEFNATLRERERVAVDLHDTVEQALTGVSYQLVVSDALHDGEPDRSRQHLRLAQQLLAQSREEVRRSVWNLRAQALNGRALGEVLRDVAAGLAARHSTATQVTVTGEERELPDFIAGHLLLLAQEAMANAVKHANPAHIDLELAFDDGMVELRVRDDGSGFEPARAPGLAEGHLGLQGMHERMKRLGGELRIDSRPGRGTRISARVPIQEVPRME